MDDRLKALFDYTKFHIGLYSSLCTLLVAVVGIDAIKDEAGPTLPWFLLATLVCFAIAGLFGGLVGSSIPGFKTWEEFSKAKLGPWFLPEVLPAPWAASAEHTAFWIGTVTAVAGVICVLL